MPAGIKTPLNHKKTHWSTVLWGWDNIWKGPMTKECKQPASGITHAGPVLLLWPYKSDTNGLWSGSNGIHSCHGSFHCNIIKIIFIHDIPQIVLGRNSRLREAADPWVLNKHEKQSVFHLKAEWYSVPSLWDKIGGGRGRQRIMKSLEMNWSENDWCCNAAFWAFMWCTLKIKEGQLTKH